MYVFSVHRIFVIRILEKDILQINEQIDTTN